LIQPVLLFQHHQTTTPYLAGQVPLRSAAAPVQPEPPQAAKPEEEPHGQT